MFIKCTNGYSEVLGLYREFPKPLDYEMDPIWDIFQKIYSTNGDVIYTSLCEKKKIWLKLKVNLLA